MQQSCLAAANLLAWVLCSLLPGGHSGSRQIGRTNRERLTFRRITSAAMVAFGFDVVEAFGRKPRGDGNPRHGGLDYADVNTVTTVAPTRSCPAVGYAMPRRLAFARRSPVDCCRIGELLPSAPRQSSPGQVAVSGEDDQAQHPRSDQAGHGVATSRPGDAAVGDRHIRPDGIITRPKVILEGNT